jgi:hypothetical protein
MNSTEHLLAANMEPINKYDIKDASYDGALSHKDDTDDTPISREI